MEFKTTGKMDKLGRFVIPVKMRRALKITPSMTVTVEMRGNEIVIRNPEKNCCLCGGGENLKAFNGKFLCAECAKGFGR